MDNETNEMNFHEMALEDLEKLKEYLLDSRNIEELSTDRGDLNNRILLIDKAIVNKKQQQLNGYYFADLKLIKSKNTPHITVKNRSNNNFRTLQAFKNKVNDEGILQDLKKKEYYVKPSRAKRLKSENAEKQRTKDLNKDIKNALKKQNDLFF